MIVNPASQMAEAVADAPLQLAERNEALAKADDAMLARLAGPLQANAALANSPAFLRTLQPIFARRGISLPTDQQTGQIDPAQLSSLISPPAKPWNEWTPAEIQAGRALPPELRPKVPGAPAEWATAPAVSPMTQAALEQMNAEIDAKEKLLGSSTSGYQPDQFLLDVKEQQARLRNAGLDGSANALNVYLSPDGNSLADAFRDRHVSEKVQAEIDHLHELGVHLENGDSWREEREKDLRDQFGKKIAFDYAKLSVEEKRIAAQATVAERRLSQGQERLDGYFRSLDLAAQRAQTAQTNRDRTYNLSVYRALVNSGGKQLQDAQADLDKTAQQLSTMANNPQLRASPLYQSLLDHATKLQSFITENGPRLQAMQDAGTQGIVNSYSSITGTGASAPAVGGSGGATSTSPAAGTVIERQVINGVTWERVSDGAGGTTFRQAP
ncbi:MAG: hypothetical protein WCE44_02550 [Candidatus Velthaea sp.]